MTRDHRITFRLSKHDRDLLSSYVIAQNITMSKGLRRILADALDIQTNERGWNPSRR